MKITVEVNGKPVEIELTNDQVAKVKKQSTNIMERVKTFEDALIELGTYGMFYKALFDTIKHDKAGIAFTKLRLIAQALNEGWKPNWSNSSEYKYYPYFDMSSGFSSDGYGCDNSHSRVGSRLCFRTKELAEYAGKQFTALYKEYFEI